VTALLLQPLGPFALAVVAGLTAGVVGSRSGSLVAFGGTVLLAALLVAVLDVVANLRAPWHGVAGDPQETPPLGRVVWECETANAVVIGTVGAAVAGILLALPALR
jgi:hypothetical protein